MAKVVRKRRKSLKADKQSPFKNYWQKENYLLLIGGIVVLIIGNLLMAQGPWDNPISLSYSPIVLLIGYLIIFPLAIFYRKKVKNENSGKDDVPSES
jgi:ATP/ADP translocase